MSRAVKAPAATDMRVNVTPAEHRVLDHVEAMRANEWSQFAHLERGVNFAGQARKATMKEFVRCNAELAAAHFILAAELADQS